MLEDLLSSPPDLRQEARSPAHVRIEQWLVDGIAKGEIAPGDRLPAEREFAAALGVSRMTLRQALAGLERKGVLVRMPGRSGGAFVAEPKIECDLTGLAGFTEQMRRAHMRAGARVMRAQTVAASRAVAKALELSAGSSVHEVVRVRSANRQPLALERSFFPAEHFPDLLEHRLGDSLYTLLAKRYDQEPHTAVEYLEPVSAAQDEADALGVEPGTPLMLIERTAHSVAGLAVEYAQDLFRADRVRIMVRSGVSSTVKPSLQAIPKDE